MSPMEKRIPPIAPGTPPTVKSCINYCHSQRLAQGFADLTNSCLSVPEEISVCADGSISTSALSQPEIFAGGVKGYAQGTGAAAPFSYQPHLAMQTTRLPFLFFLFLLLLLLLYKTYRLSSSGAHIKVPDYTSNRPQERKSFSIQRQENYRFCIKGEGFIG